MTAPIDVIRHPRARRIRLSMDPATGRVRLTLPPRASEKRARAWAEGQSEWIAAQRASLPNHRPFEPDATFPFRGQDLRIDWQEDRSRTPKRLDDRLLCGGPLAGLERRVETWLKRAALAQLSDETHRIAGLAGLGVANVAVGDPRSRWGSCSSRGTIRYSWRLILAPPHVLTATVAHEVAHLKHMNHGPEFHALEAELLGHDPASARAWLRRNGSSLYWFGSRFSG